MAVNGLVYGVHRDYYLTMTQHNLVIYRVAEPPTWVVEYKAGDVIKKSFHTSLRKALMSPLNRVSGITQVIMSVESAK